MILDDLIIQIARDLNDYSDTDKFIRWKKNQIKFYINEVLHIIYLFFRNDFRINKIMKLNTGSYQELDAEYDLLAIISVVYIDGSFKNEIKKDVIDREVRWEKDDNCCFYPKEFKLEYFKFDRGGNNFYVYPSIPPGEDVYLKLEVSRSISFEDYNQLIPEFIVNKFTGIIIQWCLFRALSIDENSITSMQQSQVHYKACLDLLSTLSELNNFIKDRNDNKTTIAKQIAEQIKETTNAKNSLQ